MTAWLRALVSHNRLRLVDREEGFDLDLSYITPRLIAMGFPAQGAQALIRNDIRDVKRFLDSRHPGRYMVYNLCSDLSPRSKYPASLFDGRMRCYPAPDHCPPAFASAAAFCRDVGRWLSEHPENVAAVHCKAGKGRTGTMVCCFLLHSDGAAAEDAAAAMAAFAEARTKDGRGVTIPSQRRYVGYFDTMLKRGLQYDEGESCDAFLRGVTVTGARGLATTASYLVLKATSNLEGREREVVIDVVKSQVRPGVFSHTLAEELVLRGDVRISMVAKKRLLKMPANSSSSSSEVGSSGGAAGKEVCARSFTFDFHLYLNTFFLEFGRSGDCVVALRRSELDGVAACPHGDFLLELRFEQRRGAAA